MRTIFRCVSDPRVSGVAHGRRPCVRPCVGSIPRPRIVLLLCGCFAVMVAWPADLVGEDEPWGVRPYTVHIVLATNEAPVWTKERQEQTQRRLVSQAESAAGGCWRLTVSWADRTTRRVLFDHGVGLQAEATCKQLSLPESAADQVIFVALTHDARGYSVEARGVTLSVWGPRFVQRKCEPAKLDRFLLRAVHTCFAPVATVVEVKRDQIVLRPQAVVLSTTGREITECPEGAILRLVDVTRSPPRVLPWTYLSVSKRQPTSAECRVISREPKVAERLAQPTKWKAVQLAPAPAVSTLRLVGRNKKPLANCEVWMSNPLASQGEMFRYRSDVAGTVALSGWDYPLCLLSVRCAGELLGEVPFVPGQAPLHTIELDVHEKRLAALHAAARWDRQLADAVLRLNILVERIRSAEQVMAKRRVAQLRKQMEVVRGEEMGRLRGVLQQAVRQAGKPWAGPLEQRMSSLEVRLPQTPT